MPPSYARRIFARSAVIVVAAACGTVWAFTQAPPHTAAPSTSSRALGGPDGGNVYSLAVVATRPVTLFASFEKGGVFKSTDGGASWTPSDRGIPEPMRCAFAVDLVDSAVLYAECLHELFKTVDGGTSWLRLDTDFENSGVPVVAPSDSRVLYVFPPLNVFKSRDGGRQWAAVTTSGLPADGISAIAIRPSNSSVLYAGTPLGVFKSSDGGARWTSISRGLPPDADVRVLTIDASRIDTMYAGTRSHGIFKSTTDGALWTSISDGLPDDSIGRVRLGGSTLEALFALAGNGIFRSADAGDHWVPISAGLDGLAIGDFVADPFSPSTLYAGTQAGVFVTVDAGAHWASANRGAARMAVGSLVMHDAVPPTLYAQGDAGSFSSVDKGNTWRHVDGDGATSFMPADGLGFESDGSGGVIAHTKSGYFERSRTTTGWTPFAPRRSTANVKSLWFAPLDRATMYAATSDSLLTTTDGGRRWNVAGLLNGRVPSQLAIAPGHPAIAYASTAVLGELARLWRTVNGGRTWEHVDNCYEGSVILRNCRPVFDPNDINTVYVVVGPVGIGGGGDLIKRTVDGGATWDEVALPLAFSLTVLPTIPTTLFADVYDPSDFSRRLLLKSVDRGEHWVASAVGLPARFVVADIVADPANLEHLFAGTEGRGVFRSLDGGATWEPTASGRD